MAAGRYNKKRSFRRRRKPFIRRRRYGKNVRRYAQKSGMLLNAVTPVKKSYSCKFVYGDLITLNSANLSTIYGTEKAYRLNSLFDPDFSVGGHQPYGFDQMAAMYNKYIVHGVKVEVWGVNPTNPGVTLGVQIQTPSDTNTLQGRGPSHVREMPNVVQKFINTTGSQVVAVSEYIPMYRALGVSPQQARSDLSNYAATVVADPAIVPYLKLAINNINGIGVTGLNVEVRLTYYATLYDRVNLNQS